MLFLPVTLIQGFDVLRDVTMTALEKANLSALFTSDEYFSLPTSILKRGKDGKRDVRTFFPLFFSLCFPPPSIADDHAHSSER